MQHISPGPSARRKAGAACLALLAALAMACGDSRAQNAAAHAAAAPAATTATGGTADTCAMFSADEISQIVGNRVMKGAPFAGPEVCKWDTETLGDVNALVMVRLKGSIREQTLCPDLRKTARDEPRIEGVGEVAVMKSSSNPLFSDAELEACGGKGYVSVTVRGKRDEAALRQAAATLARKVFDRIPI